MDTPVYPEPRSGRSGAEREQDYNPRIQEAINLTYDLLRVNINSPRASKAVQRLLRLARETSISATQRMDIDAAVAGVESAASDYGHSIPTLDAVIAEATALHDPYVVFSACEFKSRDCRAIDRSTEAIESALRALRVVSDPLNGPAFAELPALEVRNRRLSLMAYIGSYYCTQGDYDAAARWLGDAAEFVPDDDSAGITPGILWWGRSNLDRRLKRRESAFDYAKRACTVYEVHGDLRQRVRIHAIAADRAIDYALTLPTSSAERRQCLDLALHHLNRVPAQSLIQADPSGAALLSLFRLRLQRLCGEPDDRIPNLKSIAEYAESANDLLLGCHTYIILTEEYRHLGESELARAASERAIALAIQADSGYYRDWAREGLEEDEEAREGSATS